MLFACRHFVEGFANTNDAFYFGLDTSLDAANVTVGDGQMYAYQAGDASVTLIGDVRTFQSPLAPSIGNSGLNMYWSVARSQVRCWAGTKDLKRTAFDVGSINSVELQRGLPPYVAAKAPPVATSGATPFVYGPSAANEIYGLNNDCSFVSVYTFLDPSLELTNKVLLSNDELYLYAATPAGEVWFFEAASLGDGPTWTYPLGIPVVGELAISSDGLHIFVPDVNGVVHALKVSDNEVTPVPGSTPNITAPAPTLAPASVGIPVFWPISANTSEPTMSLGTNGTAMPSSSAGGGAVTGGNDTVPTFAPFLGNTSEPTFSISPSSAGTDAPSVSPVVAPTKDPVPPVSAPTDAPVPPVVAPTEAPIPPVSENANPTSSARSAGTMATVGVLVLAAFSMIIVFR